MDASDLARWTRFAAKGGIGKCTALQDCVAQGVEDLMFLKGDEIVVLLQLPHEDQYLGYCEDVVGRFHGSAVRFHGKLKKPVFAKRQSTPGTSPSRPISLSMSTPTPSSPASTSGSKFVTSPIAHVPSSLERRTPPSRIPSPPVRSSVSNATPIAHNRTPSIASSSSHYSTRSRSHSQSHEPVSGPAPTRIHTHARKSSTASSHSAYSSGSRPQSRAASRSESVNGSFSEDTYTQHLSSPPPLPAPQATPALTDSSSAHSSFLLSPATTFPLTFPQPTHLAGKVPASVFQRSRSGSENLPPSTNAFDGSRRNDRETAGLLLNHLRDDKWDKDHEEDQGMEQDAVQDHVPVDMPTAGLREISFRGVSVYSVASRGGEGVEDNRYVKDDVENTSTKRSVGNSERGVLNEDEIDENENRGVLSSSPDDLSDGGFGIGMTLLREDDNDESEDDDLIRDPEDDDTAVGHVSAAEPDSEKVQSIRKPISLPMRVVNRGSVSPSATESEMGGDETIMPISFQTRVDSSFRNSSSSDRVFIASHQPPDTITIPPRPPFATKTSVSSRASSLVPTEDEHESDADIYDDYRYSRYSMHYSGSPAQHSSRRASKGSTKSGRSRTSERPPLPDEESWKKIVPSGDDAEENIVPPRGSERSSLWRTSTTTDHKSISSVSTTLTHPISRGAEVASTTNHESITSTRARSSLPSPVQDVTDVIVPNALESSLISPLIRAFRKSDDSKYSDSSGRNDDEPDGQEQHDHAVVLPARHLTSPKSSDDERSRSPALASSIREKIENNRRTTTPDWESKPRSADSPHLSVVITPFENDQNIDILNDSPVSIETSKSRSISPPDDTHLRVDTPQSLSSAPPSPLNPGFPPTPSNMSFPTTAPLTITKSPIPSPSTPRHSVVPPAIPFTGIPPPGRPPAHMQYAQYVNQSSQRLQEQPRSGPSLPPSDSLYSTLRLAGQQRASTIHGRTQTDLLTATGPVPISFLLPGMLPPPSPAGSLQGRPHPAAQPTPYGQASPAQVPIQNQVPGSQSAVSTPHNPGRRPSHDSRTSDSHSMMQRAMTTPSHSPGASSVSSSANLPSDLNHESHATDWTHSIRAMQPASDNDTGKSPPAPPASPLPRANFFPKTGQVRPRSRSFSGFTSDITEKVSQTLRKRSQEEGNRSSRAPARNTRSTPPSPKPPTQPPLSAPNKAGQVSRPSHVPSPLSLPPTTTNSPTAPMSPTTLHAPVTTTQAVRAPTVSAQPPGSLDPQPKWGTLGKVTSHLSLRTTPQTTITPTVSSPVALPPQRRNSGPSGKIGYTFDEEQQSLKPPSPLKSSITRQSHESDHNHSNADFTFPAPYANNSSTSSSPLSRHTSLRSKISMSALKSKGSSRVTRDIVSETPTSVPSPPTPADEETVQIKDLEFELIRPTIPQISSDYRSEEAVESKDVMSVRTADLRRDSSSVRSETLSPGGLSPSTDHRFFGSMNSSGDSFPRKSKGPEGNTSVQAHRDRELKWISTMNSSDPSQAKKSKKIKKLLIEGVPSSVRYLVWAHISNSGSKKMPNVYMQLSKRRPAMAQDIERDVELCFPDHPHLHDPNGPLVSVLFAYIAMVPDLHYHRGLAIIAGHLLLQSPEEDAFWTFLAMMDSYLRPYFMPTSPQMGIDTRLFVKAMEATDAELATRVFATLNVRPNELCGVWFSSVFAGTLPLEHLHRVWDLFIYEGVPLLLRVGLAIFSICRRYLFELPVGPGASASPMTYLLRPPPEVLPADPEHFISHVLAMKLKDDDVRKSRIKMEAAVKQQRIPRGATSQPSHPHLQGGRARV